MVTLLLDKNFDNFVLAFQKGTEVAGSVNKSWLEFIF
jgi:hypothetical protein